MNLMFWKKKRTADEEGSDSSADETLVVATGTNPAPAKPGFWKKLKNTLSLSRKKSDADEEEAEPSAEHKDNKHQDDGPEAPPPKPGILARLRNLLLPSRMKGKAKDEKMPDESRPSAKNTDNKQPDEEPEPSDFLEKEPRKRLVIVLALLIPLAVGGGFFAATKLFPQPQRQKVPPAKDTAARKEKVDGHPAPEPTVAAEQTPQPGPEQPPLAEPAPQQADNATPPAEEAPEPPTEAPIAEMPAEGDIQAQIQAIKRQNQEMQAQIEALKKQPAAAKSTRSAASAAPREGVLIINGKDTKESVQGLKKVIEGMNAASGEQNTGKKK